MKKIRKVIWAISILLVVLCLITYLIVNSISIRIDPTFAQSISLEIDKYNEMKAANLNIDETDTKALITILSGRAWIDTPSCPFGEVRIILKGNDKSIIIYPSGDDCPIMRIIHQKEDYYLYLSDENNLKLRSILKEYGVIYPFGI